MLINIGRIFSLYFYLYYYSHTHTHTYIYIYIYILDAYTYKQSYANILDFINENNTYILYLLYIIIFWTLIYTLFALNIHVSPSYIH